MDFLSTGIVEIEDYLLKSVSGGTILNIVKAGDPILRTVAEPVELKDGHVSKEIQELLNDMTETMYKAMGIGLAAPQIGISKRLIVVDILSGTLYKLINPEIIETSGSQTDFEGCLSIPNVYDKVTRSKEIIIKAIDITGSEVIISAKNMLARAFQHEIDHLDGVLFTDKISS